MASALSIVAREWVSMSEYETYAIQWQGISITVSHCDSWLCDDGSVQHIELHAAGRTSLPVTHTGYRSLFLQGQSALADFNDDPVAYVIAWLDHEASSQNWTRVQQLSLF